MKQVNIHEAKSTLSRLIQDVEAGEEVVIARAGKPVVKLVPMPKKGVAHLRGRLKGHIWVAPDFDDPDPEFERLFYDEPIFPNEDRSKA